MKITLTKPPVQPNIRLPYNWWHKHIQQQLDEIRNTKVAQKYNP